MGGESERIFGCASLLVLPDCPSAVVEAVLVTCRWFVRGSGDGRKEARNRVEWREVRNSDIVFFDLLVGNEVLGDPWDAFNCCDCGLIRLGLS